MIKLFSDYTYMSFRISYITAPDICFHVSCFQSTPNNKTPKTHCEPPNNEATDVKKKNQKKKNRLSRKREVGDDAETSAEGNTARYNEYLISCRLSVIEVKPFKLRCMLTY